MENQVYQTIKAKIKASNPCTYNQAYLNCCNQVAHFMELDRVKGSVLVDQALTRLIRESLVVIESCDQGSEFIVTFQLP